MKNHHDRMELSELATGADAGGGPALVPETTP